MPPRKPDPVGVTGEHRFTPEEGFRALLTQVAIARDNSDLGAQGPRGHVADVVADAFVLGLVVLASLSGVSVEGALGMRERVVMAEIEFLATRLKTAGRD